MQQANFFSNPRSSPLPFHRQLYNNPLNNHSKPVLYSENVDLVSNPLNKIIQNFHDMKNPFENPDKPKPPENKEENPDNLGSSLVDFKILEELGKGSYGIVYKVRSLINKKEYVIKKIDLKVLNAKHRKESLQEVQLLKKLSHPNMIKYYHSFLEKDILFIVMEYAEGGDLQKLIKSKKDKKENFTEQEIWCFAQELLQAINHLHSNSIIHRDIKTLNVFLSKTQQIKLGDLGVSKIVSQAGAFEGTRVGTPLYLAPELVQNRPYDYKIDVWALGCVLYHLTNLEPPFIGENLISLGYNIVNKPPKPLNVMYSIRLSNFIFRLLEKNPGKRPRVADLLREIEISYKKTTREEKKREKIEVSNEKEYLMLKRNILEEKGMKYKKIHEKYNKIIEKNEEKIQKNTSIPVFSEYLNNNNNNLNKFESFSQIKMNKNVGNPVKIASDFENPDKNEKMQEKNIETKEKLVTLNEDKEKLEKNQIPLKNNFMNNDNKEEEAFPRKTTENEKDQILSENKRKCETLPKSDKRVHSIFEIKNPKNINSFIFSEKGPHYFKNRPVSASFKPKLRTAENFYPQLKNLLQQKQENQTKTPEIPPNSAKLQEHKKKPEKNNYGIEEKYVNNVNSKSPFLLRPKSAMLPYSRPLKDNNGLHEKMEIMRKSKIVDNNGNNLEDYSETKGIKPHLKYDGNYIDNDETKKYRNGEIFKDSAEGLPKAIIRPQTAVIRGEMNQNSRKKLTIYDLF